MKKSVFIIVFLIFGSSLNSQEFNEPFRFRVFETTEVAAIFTDALPFFDSIDEGKPIDKAKVEHFLNRAYSNDKAEYDMTKCFLKAHFRTSKNKDVQKIVKSNFNKLIPKNESEAINYRYNSKVNTLPNGKVQYIYKNFEDEDFTFDRPTQFNLSGNALQVFLPATSLDSITFSASPDKEVYMAGGQTAALKIKITKEEYKTIPDKIVSSDGCIRYDISKLGVTKINHAKKTVLEFLENTEDLFIFNLKLYDEQIKTVYTINYYYNISPINMNYKIFDQLKKHLLYYALFSYLEK